MGKRPANDNNQPDNRRVINELPGDLPITALELALIETFLPDMIESLATGAANDNAPAGEPEPERQAGKERKDRP